MKEEPLKNAFPTSCCRKSKLWRNKKTMNYRKKCIDFGANLFCQNRSIHPREPIRIHFFSDNNILKDCCRFGQCTRFSKPKFGIIGKCIIGVQAFFFNCFEITLPRKPMVSLLRNECRIQPWIPPVSRVGFNNIMKMPKY